MAVRGLKVYRLLDQALLSKEAIAYFTQYENGPEYVENDRARNYEWTSEVIDATEKYALVEDGIDGPEVKQIYRTLAAAEKARDSARVVVDWDLPEDADEEPAPQAKAYNPDL